MASSAKGTTVFARLVNSDTSRGLTGVSDE